MIRKHEATIATVLLACLSPASAWAAARPAPPASSDFPPKMQAFPLYGEAAVPNSKPGPDQETSADGSWIKKVSRPVIQVYLPAGAKATGASVVIFPGGAYAGLTFDYEGTQQANYFVDHGIAAFVVKYRIPDDQTMLDKAMGPLKDAQQAMRFARQHAAAWNLDPHRIGAVGFSAGGHVASMLATHFDQSYVDNPEHVALRPDFVVLVYPVISMDARLAHLDSRKALLGAEPAESRVRFFSSELHVTGDTPPTLLLHAADDGLVDVDNSVVFFEALRHAGVPVETRLFEKGGHGFFRLPRDRWQGAIMEWLVSNGWLSARLR
jgi:acetyl esterase/lipase